MLAAAPGVVSAGAISDLPLSGSNTSDSFTIEGRPAIAKEAEPLTEYRIVTPRYFESMGIPLLSGRDFAQTDTKQSPNVVVINDAFARRHFAGENPLGHRLKLQGQERDPLLIVGVVGNVREFGLDEQPTPEAYVPFLQDPLSTDLPAVDDDCGSDEIRSRRHSRVVESGADFGRQESAGVRAQADDGIPAATRSRAAAST